MSKTKNITLNESNCNIDEQGFLKTIYPEFTKECDDFEIIIPQQINNIKVQHIFPGSFYFLHHLVSIEIPNTVKSIGYETFAHCDNLREIIIPDSVIALGTYAFTDCQKLESVHLSENLKDISQHTFWDCINLKNINIPKGTVNINDGAFGLCENLQSLVIKNNIEYIHPAAFYYCRNLNIVYKGFEKELKAILDKSLLDSFNEDNINIFSTGEIDEYIKNISNTTKCFPKINLLSQKEYAVNELDKIISATNDLNLKLKILNIKDFLNRKELYEEDYIER